MAAVFVENHSQTNAKLTSYGSLSNLSCIVPRLPAMIYTFTVNEVTGECGFPFVSEYCEDMFGLPASQIIEDAEAFVNMVHPDDVGMFTESVMESMTKLSTWDLKMRMVTKSGSVIRVHGRSSPYKSMVEYADGSIAQLTVWCGALFNISLEAKTNGKECQHDVDASPRNVQPCFGVDKNGVVKEWNCPMAELTGFDRSDMINKHYNILKPESNHLTTQMPFFDTTMTNPNQIYAQNIQLRAKPENGYVKYVYATFRERVLFNNEISGFYCTCQDVTALKICEKEKDEAIELLDAEKNVTEWLSHEIRNPLSIAMEASFALKDSYHDNERSNSQCSLVDESGTSYVDLISQCIVYVVDLLTNVLDLNKCVEGKIVLRPKLWMLREDIISPTVQMMSLPKYFDRSSNEVPIHVYSDEDIKIYVDKLRLKQVLTNLVSNSIKFTSKGFIRISMSRVQQDNTASKSEGEIMITVSDSGQGISAKDYDKIFKKWEQFSPTSNGSGIGLCISRHLVNAMGGTIEFNREYHSGIEGCPGAQFIVILPVNSVLALDHVGNAIHSVSAYSAVSAAVIANKSAAFNLKKRLISQPTQNKATNNLYMNGKFRLLIVDDDKMNRKIFRRRFSRLFPQGTIEDADSGEKAIELTSVQHYDIIFIDQFMGEMNGDEAIRSMRENGIDSVIVGISANARSETHIHAGAEDFFQKPIPRNPIFLERIIKHLPPPAGWSVLIVDDVNLNIHFLKRKLCKVASAHFISLEIAQKNWTISSCSTANEAVDTITSQWFDLIILDNNLGSDEIKGMEIARIARKQARNTDAIIVINSGSENKRRLIVESSEESLPFDIYWPKPLPSVEEMRQSLCQALIRS